MLAERCQPVVEHRASGSDAADAGRDTGIIRSSATPRDAFSTTSSLPPSRGASAAPSDGTSAAVTSRSPSAARYGSSGGDEIAHGAASRSGSSRHQAAATVRVQRAPCGSQLPHGAGDEHQPAPGAHGPGRGDGGAEGLRIGVVAVVEDGEPPRLPSARPGHRESPTAPARAPAARGRAPAARTTPRPASRWPPGAGRAAAG